MNIAVRSEIPANIKKAFASFESTGTLDPKAVRSELAEQDLYTALGLGVFSQDIAGMDEKDGIDKAMGKPGEVEINRADVPPASDAASLEYKTVQSTYSADGQGHFQMTSTVTTEDDQTQYFFFQSPADGSAKYAIATVANGKTEIEGGCINQTPGHEATYKETVQY